MNSLFSSFFFSFVLTWTFSVEIVDLAVELEVLMYAGRKFYKRFKIIECLIQTLVVHFVANTLFNDDHASNPLFQLHLTEISHFILK